MRILLMSMPDIMPHFPAHAWRAPSLACGVLAANAPKHDCRIADLILKREDVPNALREAMRTVAPQLVCMSAMSFQYETARKCAAFIKREFPGVPIALGGYHATMMYMELSESEEGQVFDFILRGEGENSFRELADALDSGGDLSTVKGLSFKADGRWHHNEPGELVDLERVNFPKRDARIWSGYRYYSKSLDVIETSRGCVMPCTFCSMKKMYGKTFREYPISHVIADIADAKARGVKSFLLADDNFTLNTPRFIEICKAIVRHGLNDIFYIIQASSHGIATSPELVHWMDKANFRIVFLGIENVSPQSLRAMKKGDIVEKTRQAVKILHKHDIMIVGGMIIGFPWDDPEGIRINYEFFNELDIEFFGDQIITPYPKTAARDEQVEAGYVVNYNDLKFYNGYWANVRTDHLSADELLYWRWKYRRIYIDRRRYSTKAFRRCFPQLAVYRALWQRNYRMVRAWLRDHSKSQREIFERDMSAHIQVNNFFGDLGPYRPFDEVYKNDTNRVKPAASIPTPGGRDAITDWQKAIEIYSSPAS